jgi:hypothetical protein
MSVTIDGVWIGFVDHFNTRLVTTLNYSAIADLHILKITRAHAKSFLYLHQSFPGNGF